MASNEELKIRKDLLEALQRIEFPVWKKRENISGNKKLGFVLGNVFQWGDGLKNDPRRFRPSKKTNQPKYHEIWLLVNKLMKAHDPTFKWDAVGVTNNNRTSKHTDRHNQGVTKSIGLGDYTGGELLIYDEDGKNPKALPQRNRWITFDGNRYPHETMPWKGNRYALIFYKVGRKGFKGGEGGGSKK